MAKSKEPTVVGRKIVEVRRMTQAEADAEGWDRPRECVVLVLDNGDTLFPSQDGEGNGPGVLFGKDKKGEGFYVFGR